MFIVNLYNNIYDMLSNDEIFLNYLGLNNASSLIDKANKIQKRSEPQNLTNKVPLVAFYTSPGSIEKSNYVVYNAPFIFNIYTNDDVGLAHSIADRLFQLINNKLLPMFSIENFNSRFITAHESKVDINNIYCFTVVFEFSVSIE